ncbi:phytoene/squalene synthase family protein [Pedobacter sp. BMA]|uniref:phytoene/squalene synthase family protein n=1 Tax=Pedobacter sp. BMA TaxID=1663685 RepID=UPI00064A6DC7|nr:phytoene/squalene synthase family protein [Pedobacter sp. BMA]KLT67082.1 phytoene synthase [Pedobacter sp. BMA]
MKKIFDELSLSLSKETTKRYSTSFSLGILCLGRDIRNPIYSIYAFVRLADEIVDSFDGYPKSILLKELAQDCFNAIDRGISTNPIIHSFQQTVAKYNIDHELIKQFLHSMEMDLQPMTYDNESFEKYILGSAEVVGLMCLYVFTNGNAVLFDSLKRFAMRLGSAFQKINFLRDMKADSQNLGRNYFPDTDLSNFSEIGKETLLKDISKDFDEGLKGIRLLPRSSRYGVYLAYGFYKQLQLKIAGASVEILLNKRIRVSNYQKLKLIISCYASNKLNLI